MKLSVKQIFDFISDAIGDENLTEYKEDERLRDLNLINNKFLTQAGFHKGGNEFSATIKTSHVKAANGSAVITLTRETPIEFVEYNRVGFNTGWKRIQLKDVSDSELPIEELRNTKADPEFFIRVNNTIELLPCVDEALNVNIYQSEITDDFTPADLTVSSSLDIAVHDILIYDMLMTYYTKRDMKIPKKTREDFLDVYSVFKKVYAPKKRMQMSLKRNRPM